MRKALAVFACVALVAAIVCGCSEPATKAESSNEKQTYVYIVSGGKVLAQFVAEGGSVRCFSNEVCFSTTDGNPIRWKGDYLTSGKPVEFKEK